MCGGGAVAGREELGRLKSEELLPGVLATTDSGADTWGLGTAQGSGRWPRPLATPLTFHVSRRFRVSGRWHRLWGPWAAVSGVTLSRWKQSWELAGASGEWLLPRV